VPVHLTLLAVGLVLLTVAADRLVLAAVRLSRLWGLSPVLIGAVVIGFGTSLPELLVSGFAAAEPGGIDIAFGNIVGSNIANVTLVLGLSVLIAPVGGQRRIIRQEGLLMFAGLALLTGLSWDLTLHRLDAALLGTAMAVVLTILVRSGREADGVMNAEVEEMSGTGEVRAGRELGLGIGSLALTLGGAQLLLRGAEGVAEVFGLPDAVVGITLVAVGTSLPELATAVAAARRRENDLILGNVLGSNLFNALAVGGLVGAVGGGALSPTFRPGLVSMLGVAAVAGVFALTRDHLSRAEGAVLLVGYLALLPVLV